MVVYVICTLLGVIIGGFCCILFFQSAKLWLKLVSSGIGIIGTTISYSLIGKITGVTNLEMQQKGFAFLLSSLIVSTIVVFWGICKVIKEDDKDGIIRVRDILLGQQDYIKEIYKKRGEELSKTHLLERERKEIDIDRVELQNREVAIKNREEMLKRQIEDKIYLQLPIDSPIPVTNELIGKFRGYIEGLAKFLNDVDRFTQEYIQRRKEVQDDSDAYKILYSYFLGICSFIMEDVFDTSSSTNVRIHFRILSGDHYVKLVAKCGKNIYEDDLTPIPKDKGLTSRSYLNQTSLISSLNSTESYKANNRNVWEDYMTICFYNIRMNDDPYLSMGISVKNKERYKDLLYFLNFYKIENILQEYLGKIDKEYDIVKVFESRKDGMR